MPISLDQAFQAKFQNAFFLMTFHMSSHITAPFIQRAWRLLACLALFGLAYQVAQWQPMRNLYSPWDKYAHAFAFFSVWWALLWALGWRPLYLALVSVALGSTVEIHQMFLPGFTPSWADWGADLVGISMALAIWNAWGWLDQRATGRAGRQRVQTGVEC